MRQSDEKLKRIYERTSGYCHICRNELVFSNYGSYHYGEDGAWEVEHSNPRAAGGTDHLTNLYAACIPCNRAKGQLPTRSARAKHGWTCAPLNREKRAVAKRSNM